MILFLFAHVVDTAVVGWGAEAYNRVVGVYHNWVVKLLEIGLVGAVLHHTWVLDYTELRPGCSLGERTSVTPGHWAHREPAGFAAVTRSS